MGWTVALGWTVTLPLEQAWQSLHQAVMSLAMPFQMTRAAMRRRASG
jgi:hypothetical protein